MRRSERPGKSQEASAATTETPGGAGGSAIREIDGAGVRAPGDGGGLG